MNDLPLINNGGEIRCYDNWVSHIGEVPTPTGDPSFYCKRIWFHEWNYGLYYDWEEVKLGGVVKHLWIYGYEKT